MILIVRIGVLIACLLPTLAMAAIEVFTVSGVPATHVPDNATVVELDKPARLDKQLSDGLPRTRKSAVRVVQQRLPSFEKVYGEAYTGLVRAWHLGVTKLPAVVVNGQYVVYGQPNVRAAVAEINRAQASEK